MQAAKAFPTTQKRNAQALLVVVRCGEERGLTGLRLVDDQHVSAGEYFIPFAVSNPSSEHGREFTYAGVIAALDRLRDLKINRLLLLMDDATLVNELERKVEPPRDLFLQYVILGCKLNEFARARVVVTPSERLETLRAKTVNLAATIYREHVGTSSAQPTMLPLAPAM
ncbi:MAG TPA: hypothetical protein VKR99_00915 [Candidatus Eremiobacteraceae bacterium]|nr:hypothetical protein [Candidatus Eremiobacteraceae bacterium]